MYTDKRTYADFDGVTRTETFYFNLTEAELAELELTTDGGIKNRLEKIVEAKDNAEIARQFKKIILAAYGEKSPDGKHFFKSPEISARYTATQAYSDFFMALVTNDALAAEFVNKIIPETMRKNNVTVLPGNA